MKNVDTSKACGHDRIGNKIIKLCFHDFSSAFTSFVNLSLCVGQFRSQWNLASIIPFFKNDNRQLKVYNRPVLLLSSLSKLCEKNCFCSPLQFFY